MILIWKNQKIDIAVNQEGVLLMVVDVDRLERLMVEQSRLGPAVRIAGDLVAIRVRRDLEPELVQVS